MEIQGYGDAVEAKTSLRRRSCPTLQILKHVTTYAAVNPPGDAMAQASESWTPEERGEFAVQVESLRDDFWRALRSSALWRDMSPTERKLADATAMTMTLQQRLDASWRLEAARALMWALQLLPDLPPYDSETDPAVLELVPSVDDQDFARNPRLRDAVEIEQARGMAELWHWRSRTREIIESGDAHLATDLQKATGFRSYDDIVRHTARTTHQDGDLTEILDEDFVAFQKPYRQLDEDEWSIVRSITIERHHSLNWMCGYAPSNRWDQTPTDT